MKKALLILCLAGMLTACAPAQPTMIDVQNTAMPMPTFTALPLDTPLVIPTMQDFPLQTLTPTRTPLPAVLPKFPLTGYVMLFKKDNDLYFQDGENSPVKLAHIEGNNYPLLYPVIQR